MPTLELEAWPLVGTTYAHWTDLLLATQLSALRRGYGQLEPLWAQKQPEVLTLNIGCRPLSLPHPAPKLCLVAEQRRTQGPGGAWAVIVSVREAKDTRAEGEASEASCMTLRAGDLFADLRELAGVEGALRAAARKDGRFLSGTVVRPQPVNGYAPHTLELTCVLPASECDFHVFFREIGKSEPNGHRWRCIKVQSAHSCVATGTAAPSQDLQSRIDSFVPIELHDSACEPAWTSSSTRQRPNNVEKQFGTFPVEAACDESVSSGSEPVPEPSPESAADSDTDSDSESDAGSDSAVTTWQSAASSHAGLHRSLVNTCAAALSAETDLTVATAWLERCAEDALAAQARLESQRKLVQAHQLRAAQKRQRLQQQVEREQRRTVPHSLASATRASLPATHTAAQLLEHRRRRRDDAVMQLPNGLVTVASLDLATFLASGFAPDSPPPGLLDRITYSVERESLSIMLPPDLGDEVWDKMHGVDYELQPVVGWKSGIDTRPADYIAWCSSSDPFVPGDHPLAEAASDERTVRTGWLSEEEAAAADGASEVVLMEAQPLCSED